jgi:hypothetical protein
VREISGAASARTGAIDVDVTLDDLDVPVVSGLMATVMLELGAPQSVSFVPARALVQANGEQGSVFRLAAGREQVQRVSVQVGFIRGAQLAIVGGLEGVDQVVSDGAAYLSDGARVMAVR